MLHRRPVFRTSPPAIAEIVKPPLRLFRGVRPSDFCHPPVRVLRLQLHFFGMIFANIRPHRQINGEELDSA